MRLQFLDHGCSDAHISAFCFHLPVGFWSGSFARMADESGSGGISGFLLTTSWDIIKNVLGSYGYNVTEGFRPAVRELLTAGRSPINDDLQAASHRALCRAIAKLATGCAEAAGARTGVWRSLAQHWSEHHTLRGWSLRTRLDQESGPGAWLATLLVAMEKDSFKEWHARELYGKATVDDLFRADPGHPLSGQFASAFLDWIKTGAGLGDGNQPAGFAAAITGGRGGLWVLHGMEFREQLKHDPICFRAATLCFLTQEKVTVQPLTRAEAEALAERISADHLAQWDAKLEPHFLSLRQKLDEWGDLILIGLDDIKEDTSTILRFLKERLPALLAAARAGLKITPPRQLPTKAPELFGRAAEIETLLGLMQSHRRVAVTGAGGLGKTALCAALIAAFEERAGGRPFAGGIYAHDFYQKPGLASFLASILRQAGLSDARTEDQPALVAVALRQPGVLLYLEGTEKLSNVDDLLAFLDEDTRLLLTTRDPHQAAQLAAFPLGPLAEAEAAQAIHYYASSRPRLPAQGAWPHPLTLPGWRELARDLGGHPLACRLAGELCAQHTLRPEALHEELRQEGLQPLLRGQDSKHNLHVLFRQSALAVRAASPGEPSPALAAWHLLTLGGTSPTPLSVLQAWGLPSRSDLNPLLELQLAVSTDVAGEKPGTTEPAYALTHTLLGEWGRTELAEFGHPPEGLLIPAMKWGVKLFDTVAHAACVPGGPSRYKVMAALAENLLREVEGVKGLPLNQIETLFHLPARLHHLHAEYLAAEPLLQKTCREMEMRAGADAPQTADALNNLAQLLKATNRLREAEPLMRRALAIDEIGLGQNHPTIAIRLNNLASLLQDTNRVAEAEPLMRRALAIAEMSLGQNHPHVATGLNNLAQLLQATNRLAEAEPLMRRALAIDEANLGHGHPLVAIRLNNLASLLQDTSRAAEAEPLMRRAVAIIEASLGSTHPDIAISLNNLASLLQDTSRAAEAEPLMRRALTIVEASLGPMHPNVGVSLNNLARLLHDTDRRAEAEPLMRRALAIDEASYGLDHPMVAIRLNNLASLLQATNRLAEAEPLMRRMALILLRFTRDSGHQYPNLRVALQNYAKLLLDWKGLDVMKESILSLGPEASLSPEQFKPLLAAAFSEE